MNKKYHIVKASESKPEKAIEEMQTQVNQLYNEGWAVHGSPKIIKEESQYCADSYFAYQAMVKENKDDTCIICGATRCYFLNYEGKLICAKCAGAIKNMI